MNTAQIIGFVLITIGTIVSFVGSYQQSKQDNQFQNNVSNYVSKQESTSIPVLKVIRVINAREINSSKIVVKNIGKESANKVSLMFDENSYPNAFSANLITQLREITPGEEVTISLNLFSGIKMLEKLPNSDLKYKEQLLEDLKNFKNGDKAFIPKFHLEFFHNKELMKSEQYFLLVEYQKGITAFDKFIVD
jgi:hypothetical protein